MEDDPAVAEVMDIDFVGPPASEVDKIEIVPHQDLEAAARAVIEAAIRARRRELVEVDEDLARGYNSDDIGDYSYYLVDYATGERYAPIQGGWLNLTTSVELRTDPRDIDASEYEWIAERFRYFHERWPAYPHAMAEHCGIAKRAIQSGGMTPIQAVARAVGLWGGDARSNFVEYFLDPFMSQAVTNQQALLDELAVALYAYEAILRQGRLDAQAIADQTVNVLDSMSAGPGTDASIVLGVVGVAVTVVSAILSGGTTALTLGLVGAGLELAEAGVQADQTVSGDTVDGVLRRMDEVLDTLRQGMDAEENLIADAIERQEGEVRGWLASDDSLEVATILPTEPADNGVTDLTSGRLPGHDEFRPRR